MSSASCVMRRYPRWRLDGRASLVGFTLLFILPFACTDDAHLLQSSHQDIRFHVSYINVSYLDRETKKEIFKKFEGKYGKNSIISSASGVVMHAISSNKSGTSVVNNYGCTTYGNQKFPSEHWIALVERGMCSFSDKIKVAMKEHNASAIVIYDNRTENTDVMTHDKVVPSISVSISQSDGKEIAHLLQLGYTVRMQIIPGPEETLTSAMQNSISKTSVLFVSISFIVLMIISLAWLVFYYIQRFRYSHAKERLARRLVCAAKKAIAKIPQRTVKTGDKELDSEFDQCAVCIEPYKAHDVIRILPCRHVFHKSCVDPWLLDQRSCPMCKLDILRAFGMQIGGSQESVHQDVETAPVIANVLEPEVSSSAEDTQTEEIKVLLVPHTCLHFRSGCGKAAVNDEEVASGLLGAVGGAVSKSSSSCSLNSKGSRYSRADKDESFNSEMKSLIGKGKGKGERWRSKEDCTDEDDVDVNNFSDNEHLGNVIETVLNSQEMISEQDDESECLDSCSKFSFPPPPTPLSLSSEQLNTEAPTPSEEFLPVMMDDQVHSGPLNRTIDDNAVCEATIVNVEFLKDDQASMNIRT